MKTKLLITVVVALGGGAFIRYWPAHDAAALGEAAGVKRPGLDGDEGDLGADDVNRR